MAKAETVGLEENILKATMTDFAECDDPYDICFDMSSGKNQDEEYFLAWVDGKQTRFNIHDYDSLYQHPLLYDIALYKYLRCRTPQEICTAVKQVWDDQGVDPRELRVLELGAGSGIFAEAARAALDICTIIGLDNCANARVAALRDRPGVYTDYLVADLTALSDSQQLFLKEQSINCVAVASATGWGNHIPVKGFEAAYSLLGNGHWFIFHVKPHDPDPECQALCTWLDDKIHTNSLCVRYRKSHYHRMSHRGTPIMYDIVIGQRI